MDEPVAEPPIEEGDPLPTIPEQEAESSEAQHMDTMDCQRRRREEETEPTDAPLTRRIRVTAHPGEHGESSRIPGTPVTMN